MTSYRWIKDRAVGIFAHISSLPSTQGIGNIGASAIAFLDYLKGANIKYWQICPLGATSLGDSPYQSFSAFAGNPYFIDFEELKTLGLLSEEDLKPLRALSNTSCEYGALYEFMPSLLKLAYSRYSKSEELAKNFDKAMYYSYEDFCLNNKDWIDDYALFTALKGKFGGVAWQNWDKEFKDYNSAKKQNLKGLDLDSVKFIQWVFFSQYAKTKKYAEELGVEIIGDIPIFLSADSVELWSMGDMFDLDDKGELRVVSGVGPDYFSPEGQLWGNPLYDWDKSYDKCLAFWEKRLAKTQELFDVVRIDHFRAFADYWAIDAKSNSALDGEWAQGVGIKFFEDLKKIFPKAKLIAEDLGLLSEEAIKLRDDIDIASMAVLQFAFGGEYTNSYLPYNQHKNMICYCGTHDNDSTASWYANTDDKTKDHFRRYMRTDGSAAHWDMIYAALSSPAGIAIIMLQDIFGLGEESRINVPGKAWGNWQWRIEKEALEDSKDKQLKYLGELSVSCGRIFS